MDFLHPCILDNFIQTSGNYSSVSPPRLGRTDSRPTVRQGFVCWTPDCQWYIYSRGVGTEGKLWGEPYTCSSESRPQ